MARFTVLGLLASLATAIPAPQLLARQDVITPFTGNLPNVTIFSTGGTIASQGTSSEQTVGYTVGLGVEQLIEAVPDIRNVSSIRGFQVANVDSGSINETIILNLSRMVNEELARPDVTGVVITHGTDTLEETAFFLDLTVDSSKPVVVVGAMRPATALSADGPMNLLQAVTVAASPNARDRGTLITLNDRIGSAFYSTKINANTPDAFYSTEASNLGLLVDQNPLFYYQPSIPTGRPYFELTNVSDLPTVDILYAYQDMDTMLVQEAVNNGAQGIVIAGVGAGGMSTAAQRAAQAVVNATGIPLITSHRTTEGFVLEAPIDPLIPSGFYNPQKSRILLQLALAKGLDQQKIAELFNPFANTSA